MRILMVNKLAWPAGGAERYTIDLVRGLRAGATTCGCSRPPILATRRAAAWSCRRR